MASPLGCEDDLKKLTVPQLKLMCKERCITGYTKLPKAGVIAKLLDWRKRNGALSLTPGLTANTAAQISSANDMLENNRSMDQETDLIISVQHRSSSKAIRSKEVSPVLAPKANTPTANSIVDIPTFETSPIPSLSILQKVQISAVSQIKSICPPEVTPAAVPFKRPHGADSVIKKLAKKPKTLFVHADGLGFVLPQDPPSIPLKPTFTPGSGTNKTNSSFMHPSIIHGISGDIRPKQNRFKALVPEPGKKVTSPPNSPHVKNPSRLRYLDFALESPIPQLQFISLPPSIAQRKHVSRLALLLRNISLRDFKTCTLVSRLFRYSAYLAAYHQLLRAFPGARLQNVFSAYPSNEVINFWPYLFYRMNEVNQRKSIYEASFLGQAIKCIYGVSEKLWTSPNDPKQAAMAIRFLLTRLFFYVSLGYGSDISQSQKDQSGLVLNAQEIIPHEIWTITVQSSSSIDTFYVLEATCEVIGQQEAAGTFPCSRSLRADWSSYIAARRCSPSPPEGSKDSLGLLEHLQWSNHEEYSRGISKVWLSRIGQEGDVGSAKLEVARRYILACVVSNSVSGPRLSSNQMQQEFNGIPKTRDSMATKSDRINIFVPAHHHVESVHFTLSNGRYLHPGLATVQTPGREYYILKDNGMQVGCEEDGVADVWMELLGCTKSGCI